MEDILVKSLMTKEVQYTSPGAGIKEIVHTLRDLRHSCIVVVENDVPIGIITERDLVRCLAEFLDHGAQKYQKASDIMSSPPVTINETETLFHALTMIQEKEIRHLIVIDSQDQLKGLITQSDLAKAQFYILKTQHTHIEESIKKQLKELKDANENLKALSLEDPLLQIGNRRAMEIDLEITHALTLRYQRPYALILFDIDHFKPYNDQYGHIAGDQLLIKVAEYLKKNTRKPDRLYRYGGDEIIVLLPETDLDGATVLAHRIIKGFHDLKTIHTQSPFEVVTISGGIGSCKEKNSWKEVVEQADKGLYRAKHNGRNQLGCSQ